MRSEIVFVMHPDDEGEFAAAVVAERGTVLVDGPGWRTPRPPLVNDIRQAGNHLMVWNPSETRPLTARHHVKDGEEWWYCDSEFLTVQFLRSGFQHGEPYLFEGRIAIATTDEGRTYPDESSAASIQRRFERLRAAIKKTCTNGVLIWQNVLLPRSRTNPAKPALNVWVGPHALRWLREDVRNRWVQQFRQTSGPRAYLLDMVRP
jgi:hypothetical protein